MTLLTRYLLRSFLLPFTYLMVGLLAIWLLADLANYLNDFLEAKVPVRGIASLYWKQLPFVIVPILPVSVMLALLYSVIRLSQANELQAMSGSGISYARILLPFIGVGVVASVIVGVLNYRLAPEAEGAKGRLVAELTGARDGDGRLKIDKFEYATGHLYANRRDARLWYVQRLARRANEPFRGVQVTQQDAAGNVIAKFDAPSALYDEKNRTWKLEKPRIVRFDESGELIAERFPPEEIVREWTETPAQIAAATLQAQFLGVPELRRYLTINADDSDSQLAPFRTQLLHRYSFPLVCIALVLVAAPLSMSHARRGVIAGVAGAILILFAFFFLNQLFLALGQGNRLSPFWAAWTPMVLLLLSGAIILRRRTIHQANALTSVAGWKRMLGLG
ncbi:MAG: LptF/LptG family permease [Verrucomicrobia bacterium]|nr:LptF/LptG family permease [Verrucomicrobiota bacterium]